MAWLQANPAWAWAIVFLTAAAESIVLVGILVPGIAILFGISVLVGLDLLALAPVWIAASAGAFSGDALSYGLGYRYRERLLDTWPFSRYPGLMLRGREFFAEKGPRSVVAGRFVPPLRPIVPAVAGISGMPPLQFLLVDLAASVAWAPTFLLPGMLFGTSLEIAAQYTGRLAALLLVALAALWVAWWLLRAVYEPLASRSARWLRHAIRWTRRHPLFGRIAGPLLDPAQPEVLSVSMLGILLLLSCWALVLLLFLSPFSSQPQALDQAVQALALSLRNDLADPVMVAISQVSRWEVVMLASAALLLWLVAARRLEAAEHWLAAIGGGWILQLLLGWGLRAAPQAMNLPGEAVPAPSSALSLTTVVLVFFAVMIAREVSRRHRQWPYLVAGFAITMLALARLYLGLEWFSGVLLGLLLGLGWAAIVGIAYRQRAFQPFSGFIAGLIFYGSLALLFGWQVGERTRTETAALQGFLPTRSMPADGWWHSGWKTLPAGRPGVFSGTAGRFDAQVLAEPETIRSLLGRQGWQPVPEAGWSWMLQALNPEPDEDTLPLLGRAYEGRPEALLLRRRDAASGALLTLRLWDSGLRLTPGQRVLFLAQLSEEHLVQRLGLFSYWRSQPAGAAGIETLVAELQALEQKQVDGEVLLLREPQR